MSTIGLIVLIVCAACLFVYMVAVGPTEMTRRLTAWHTQRHLPPPATVGLLIEGAQRMTARERLAQFTTDELRTIDQRTPAAANTLRNPYGVSGILLGQSPQQMFWNEQARRAQAQTITNHLS